MPVGISLILYFAVCPLLSLNQLPLPLSPADGRLFCPVAPRQQHQRIQGTAKKQNELKSKTVPKEAAGKKTSQEWEKNDL